VIDEWIVESFEETGVETSNDEDMAHMMARDAVLFGYAIRLFEADFLFGDVVDLTTPLLDPVTESDVYEWADELADDADRFAELMGASDLDWPDLQGRAITRTNELYLHDDGLHFAGAPYGLRFGYAIRNAEERLGLKGWADQNVLRALDPTATGVLHRGEVQPLGNYDPGQLGSGEIT
jgi:hypothetical protein